MTNKPVNWRNRIVGYDVVEADQLLANPANWRIHPKAQQDALTGVLDDVGWVQEIIVNKTTGHVVDGHMRVEVAITRGESVPVKYVELTEAEELLILATIDPISAMAATDAAQLESLLQSVNSDSAAVQAMLAKLAEDSGLDYEPEVAEDAGAQIDKADELLQKWQVERGQLWVIPSKSGRGEHRLLCGDSTNADDVARVMAGERATLMVTDPPYGVEYDADWRNDAFGDGNRATGKVTNDDTPSWDIVWELAQTDIAYCWHAGLHASSVESGLKLAGYEIRAQIIWSKPHFVVGRGHYSTRHEPCWYAVRKGHQANWIGADNEQTIWDIKLDERAQGGHSTQKPLECMARPIRNHTAPIVYDPFLGSGTTLVACEQTGRLGRGLELEPKYCAVILQRLTDMGLTPKLAE